mmetsp:Transcript_3884/g.7469  ORF Transcript_3884/g.7469 Transcript_3884/m.7469 type:complete len:242 (-) Transcript_3884:86-811(-)
MHGLEEKVLEIFQGELAVIGAHLPEEDRSDVMRDDHRVIVGEEIVGEGFDLFLGEVKIALGGGRDRLPLGLGLGLSYVDGLHGLRLEDGGYPALRGVGPLREEIIQFLRIEIAVPVRVESVEHPVEGRLVKVGQVLHALRLLPRQHLVVALHRMHHHLHHRGRVADLVNLVLEGFLEDGVDHAGSPQELFHALPQPLYPGRRPGSLQGDACDGQEAEGGDQGEGREMTWGLSPSLLAEGWP